eukprot:4175019-Pleurochrysis_carterae.AAC.2
MAASLMRGCSFTCCWPCHPGEQRQSPAAMRKLLRAGTVRSRVGTGCRRGTCRLSPCGRTVVARGREGQWRGAALGGSAVAAKPLGAQGG